MLQNERSDKYVTITMPPSLVEMIDAWRRKNRSLPNRSEAIRQLVALGLRYSKELETRDAVFMRQEPEAAPTLHDSAGKKL